MRTRIQSTSKGQKPQICVTSEILPPAKPNVRE